ncbi:hypothetical protein [Nocardioides immobilis]|uniref:hypothetical protein n=1 Tax=Nocardioides immobilis TaxID=2049295 RepID=UPI0015FAE4AE|nr:hypothetical protein [Nocardioides immobilis]
MGIPQRPRWGIPLVIITNSDTTDAVRLAENLQPSRRLTSRVPRTVCAVSSAATL